VGKRITIALAVFALLAVPFGVYVSGYFCAAEYDQWIVPDSRDYDLSAPTRVRIVTVRTYRWRWQAIIYKPVAKTERLMLGNPVWLRLPYGEIVAEY
jgi:hypothetical protein